MAKAKQNEQVQKAEEAQQTTEMTRADTQDPGQLFFERYQQMEQVAELMAKGTCTVPQHLQGNVGDCFAICTQAMQWGLNPWPVAQKTHIVNGTLGYEAQLVSAIVNTSGRLEDRIHDEYFGDWTKVVGKFQWKEGNKGRYQVPGWKFEDEQGLGIKVWATLKGENEPRVLELLLSQATVRNSTLWASDPKQQLYYLAVKRWARKYVPEIIMGVYSPDELEESEMGGTVKPVDGTVTESRTGQLVSELEKEGEPESATESTHSQSEQSSGQANQTPAENADNAQSAESGENTQTNDGTLPLQTEDKDKGQVAASSLTKKDAVKMLGLPSEQMLMDYCKAHGYETWGAVPTEHKQRMINNPQNASSKISAWADQQESE